MATAKGNMVLCQLAINQFKTNNKKGKPFVSGRLTGRRRAQMDGTVPVRVVGGVRLVADGLWAKGDILMCQLPIKQFKTNNKKGESFVPGGHTGRRRAQTDGTVPVRVVVGVRLIVDGLWAELWRALGDNINF